MLLSALENNLVNLLYDACVEDIKHVEQEHPQKKFFSYTIYCDSGLVSIGSAACTRNSIEKNLAISKQAYLYAETISSNWDYVNANWQLFNAVNEQIDKVFNAFYANEISDLPNLTDTLNFEGISIFFITVIQKAIKNSKILDNKNFEDDILSGLQFGDPSDEEINFILEVSEKINSPTWHKKMLEASSS